ncbi:hypothetical protein FHE74_09025 [Corynebacterium tapiri]|uniref:Uncharacterized protein n=1 Tax=Corynebacterium tapiri TaxID=1448266 RepID=A0A5C4U2Y7_9CORY|nr:hypothetical protein FHE74_09025 [Corynebacterium tapiri]
MPGSTRRERKSWAEARGYDFARTDDYLIDEWTRGAASTGAPARDIASGFEYGHEMLLMDLGGTNVMAMRTGASSDIVVDFRRTDLGSSEDLVPGDEVAGFQSYGSDASVLQRLLDVRVTTALELMPDVVTAVWTESDWVLAQTAERSHAADWEAMLAPLALLADAARTLPPSSEAGLALHIGDFVPSRQMPPRPVAPTRTVGESGRVLAGEESSETTPLVKRPEEPLELPTRAQAQARGVVQPRSIGGDEIDAIADGSPRHQAPEEARVWRDLSSGSTLFDDEQR